MFRVQGAGFRVQGAGCRVQGAGFRVHARAWSTSDAIGFALGYRVKRIEYRL